MLPAVPVLEPTDEPADEPADELADELADEPVLTPQFMPRVDLHVIAWQVFLIGFQTQQLPFFLATLSASH